MVTTFSSNRQRCAWSDARPSAACFVASSGLVDRAHGGDQPFTLRGLQAELAERGVRVDYRTVWAFVHAEGLSFKKSVLPSEQGRPDIARERAFWKKHQASIDPRRLVFIDET